MKTSLIIASLAFTLGAVAQNTAPASSTHAEKVANIRKLMAITGGDKVANQMFDQMAASMKAAGGKDGPPPDQFLQEFRKELDFKKIEEIVVSAYDKYLSAEDIKSLIYFYQTPSGKHMLEVMPQINADMVQKIIPMGQEIAVRAMKKLKESEAK